MSAPTPYYKGSRATLYLGDCREIAPRLGARSVDLMIADPPYGVRWQSGRRTEKFDEMVGDDGFTDWPAILGDLTRRLLKAKRHVYVFGYDEDQLVKPLQLSTSCPLIWDKGIFGAGNLSVQWGSSHEPFTFGVLAHRPFETGSGLGALAARLRRGSVIQARRVSGGAVVRHPDEKPVPLMRQLVESSSCHGETVFDPTAGVGSTLVAAVLAGRGAVGIELEHKYADIAVDRLREAERIADLMEAM